MIIFSKTYSAHLHLHSHCEYLLTALLRTAEVCDLNTCFCLDMEKARYKCVPCKKGFFWKSKFMKHQYNHLFKLNHCEFCEKDFSSKTSLMNHSGKPPLICIFCNKSFQAKCQLNKHMETHRDEKPYVCEVCKKRFDKKCGLVGHVRVHSQEKRYACQVCEEKFPFKSYLKRHKQIHEMKLPFAIYAKDTNNPVEVFPNVMKESTTT